MVFLWGGGQDGVMAGGVEAEEDFGARGMFDADALSADRNAAIGADLDGGAQAPNIRPPRAAWGWAEDGAFFQAGQIPGALWSLPQFPMLFVGVAVQAQGVDVRVGVGELGDLFAGEIGWEPALPELVLALDFALGLRGWGITKANVVEFERPTQLGERVRGLGEKDAVIIDVELQWPPIRQEGRRQEIEVGQDEFPFVDFGTDEQAAAIVEHVEHGEVAVVVGEPGMRGGVQLPEFADLGTLPTAHRSVGLFGGGGVSTPVVQGPVTNLPAIELERAKAQGFRSNEAVGTGGSGGQTLFEKGHDWLRPWGGVVAARAAGLPEGWLFVGAGAEIIGGERIESARREVKLVGGFLGVESAPEEGFQNMTDEGGGVAFGELQILFITRA